MKTYTAKNIKEVLNIAAKEKNVSTEELVYHILEENTGFLGIGNKVKAFVYCNEDVKQFLYDYLALYFDNIRIKAEIKVDGEKWNYQIQLNTENNAIFIGKNGKTLQALHTVLNSVVSSKFKKRIRVMIDINGYKEEKYQKICALSMKVAKSVQQTKMDALLDPMPADERKVIHRYLSDMPNIMTKSEGEGDNRRLRIVYKK